MAFPFHCAQLQGVSFLLQYLEKEMRNLDMFQTEEDPTEMIEKLGRETCKEEWKIGWIWPEAGKAEE